MFFFMFMFGGGVYFQVKTFHVFGLFIVIFLVFLVMIFFVFFFYDYLCVVNCDFFVCSYSWLSFLYF
jgi:hypothetical protein